MSIEKDLTRIATALETLVDKLTHIGQAVDAPKPVAPVAETVTSPVGTPTPSTTTPTVADIPAPPVAAPVAPVVTAPAPVVMTPEELNKALVAEFQRLGSRDPIDTVMRAAPFNAQSITDLSPEQYAPLIAAVQLVGG